MNLQTLALVGAVALLGPLLSAGTRWRVPVVIGELVAGMIIGASGLHLVDTTDATFSFLADARVRSHDVRRGDACASA